MQALPHKYQLNVQGKPESSLNVSANNLPSLEVSPPAQFGGPGDQWSPEDLLIASSASCLVLSFKAIARASKFEWTDIECNAEGTLDKVERTTKFTEIVTKVKLTIPATESPEKAEKLLNKAEEVCLVSNSLSCESRIECEIILA